MAACRKMWDTASTTIPYYIRYRTSKQTAKVARYRGSKAAKHKAAGKASGPLPPATSHEPRPTPTSNVSPIVLEEQQHPPALIQQHCTSLGVWTKATALSVAVMDR